MRVSKQERDEFVRLMLTMKANTPTRKATGTRVKETQLRRNADGSPHIDSAPMVAWRTSRGVTRSEHELMLKARRYASFASTR